MSDLETDADAWTAYVRDLRERFATMSVAKENTIASITLLLRRHPMTGAPLDGVMAAVILAAFVDDNKSKDGMVNTARMFSMSGDAFASVFSSEAWAADQAESFGPGGRRIMPRDVPTRREILFLATEHRRFKTMSHHTVITTEGDRRRFGEWQEINATAGRFTGLITRTEVRDVPQVMQARARIHMEIERGRLTAPVLITPDRVFN